MPKLELSDEQVVELVKQLSPEAKQRLLQELSQGTSATAEEEFTRLPCFGMWAEHREKQDSTRWVRKERGKWKNRLSRD